MRYTLFSIFLLAGLAFTSCGGDTPVEELVAKGGKAYGGEFKFMSGEKITSLLPTACADHYSSRIISQIYEPLLRLDPNTLKVVETVAESFKVSNDAKVYTFKIRKGILFHDDDCFGGKDHELDAHDVKFSLDMACSGLKENAIGYLLINRIKGAQAYADKTTKAFAAGGVSGIKVVDNHTIEITLVNTFSGFENVLTHSSLGIFPKEAYDKYGAEIGNHAVGTGPFALETMGDDKIVLKRNSHYWRSDEFGNQLPFMSKVIVTYAQDKKSELMAFRKSEIDLVLEIPVEDIDHVFGSLKEAQEGKNIKHKVESESSMSMTYMAFANSSKEFSDVRVRKAFNIAINRDVIVDKWLEGEGWPANHGFVPAIGNYPIDKIKGHKFNVALAQSLMSQAGYPKGKNFPALDFYVNTKEGSPVHKLCQAVAKQIKDNINVDLNIKLCSIEERTEAIVNGKAKVWRAGWIADYPDPENFLAIFYGDNTGVDGMMNSFNFKSDAYDAMYEKAVSEPDAEKRTQLLLKCDQMVIDEAAVMPLMTDDNIVMLNARVRDFKANAMESLNLTEVFIKEPKKVVEDSKENK
jgi:ABC-type oligopeptide transport system substrate-binding subunit